MADLRISGTFDDTTALVEYLTDAGRAFLERHCGAGVVSVNVPKSAVAEVYAAAFRESIVVQ